MRDSDMWTLLSETVQSTAWSLLGMSLKHHSQTQSKAAAVLSDLMGQSSSKGKKGQKGHGKGKQKGKAPGLS